LDELPEVGRGLDELPEVGRGLDELPEVGRGLDELPEVGRGLDERPEVGRGGSEFRRANTRPAPGSSILGPSLRTEFGLPCPKPPPGVFRSAVQGRSRTRM